jgi:hypothetical protein
MNRLDYINKINGYAAKYVLEVEGYNEANQYDINIQSENFLIPVLNEIFNLNLVNVNFSIRDDYPAIDLADFEQRVAFQITSTSSLKKISDSLEKFFGKGLEQHFSQLYFYIITEKKAKYDKRKIAKFLKDDFDFDPSKHILDRSKLMGKIAAIGSTDKLQRILEVYENEFSDASNISKRNDSDALRIYKQKTATLILNKVFFNESTTKLDYYVSPFFNYCCFFYDNNDLRINEEIEKQRISLEIEFNKKEEERRKKLEASLRLEGFLAETEEIVTDTIVEKSEFKPPLFFDFKFLNYRLDRLLFDFCTGTKKYQIRTSSPCCAIVLGYPGQGKTTLCEKLFYDLNNTELKSVQPFLIGLRRIRDTEGLIKNPFETIKKHLLAVEKINIAQFDKEKIVLILDGLDEMLIREGFSPDDHLKFVIELIRSAENYIGIKIIITSRYGYIDLPKLKSESRLIVLSIREFDLAEQEEWLTKFVKYNSSESLSQESLLEYNSNTSFSFISELLKIPLLLNLFATLPKQVQYINNRSDLYDFIFTELIARKYESLKKSENLAHLNESLLRNIIREIAISIYLRKENYIRKSELIKNENIKLLLDKLSNSYFYSSLRGLLIAFYFKESAADDTNDFGIEFIHLSFFEYMVAEGLIEKMIDIADQKKSSNQDELLRFFNKTCQTSHLSKEVQKYISEIVENKKLKIFSIKFLTTVSSIFYHITL